MNNAPLSPTIRFRPLIIAPFSDLLSCRDVKTIPSMMTKKRRKSCEKS